MNTIHPLLTELDACDPAVQFASNYATLEEAWLACPNGAWMLWFADRSPAVTRRQLTPAVCAVARTVLHLATEPAALIAIETAERWARGAATVKEVKEAAATLHACMMPFSSAYVATYYAVGTALGRRDAAAACVHAASACAYAAANHTGAIHDGIFHLRQSANIVRTFFPTLPK